MTREPCRRTLVEWIRLRARSPLNWLVIPRRDGSAPPETVTFAEAYRQAVNYQTALRQVEAVPGRGAVVVLALDNGRELCEAFLGAVLAGWVPVVQSPPGIARKGVNDLVWAATGMNAALLVVAPIHEQLFNGDRYSFLVTTPESLKAGVPAQRIARPPMLPGDAAVVQFSSGTTRIPRGIMLSLDNIASNLSGLGKVSGASEQDVMVCWLPLSHDMGLVGLFLNSIVSGAQLVLMSPRHFVEDPSSWIRALSQFKGTVTAAPNFAYHICASSRVPDTALGDLDLSSVRVAVSGSETVLPRTVRAFLQRFGKYGFAEHAFCPAYGLAENTLAVAMASPSEPVRIEHIDRDAFERSDRALAVRDTERAVEFASVGRALCGQAIRIVDGARLAVEERVIGLVEVHGPSTMLGYWPEGGAERSPFTADRWLRTGDRGFLADGDLFIVGRQKNVIKRAGRTFDGAELANAIAQVPGVRPGAIAVFGVPDPSRGTDAVVVLAETRDLDVGAVRAVIANTVLREFGLSVEEVVILAPGQVPKTTSGKVRIEECQRRFASGEFHVSSGDVR